MASQASALRYDPSRRGYHAVFRPNETNHCPACGRTHWYVGRVSAECGFCATALPFAGSQFASEGRGLSH
ncbi:MAG: hypothetical protein JOZ90_03135 [Alphaproteobacteria bacterium]|nr:hypothetical protein [Alphaproteobacteria bacterium]MBV9370559.1 hypothetical protein [Alphaproteobacteria bacterium]MBV9900073.1 hypothetical protein [Alphaproteobacteria bacterium]